MYVFTPPLPLPPPSSPSEVAQLAHPAPRVPGDGLEHHVARLEVAVDDVLAVQVLDGGQHLVREELG